MFDTDGVVCWPCRYQAGIHASERARTARTVDEMPAGLFERLLFVTDKTNRDEIDNLPSFKQVLADERPPTAEMVRLGANALLDAGVSPQEHKAMLGWRKTLGVRIKGWEVILDVEKGDYKYVGDSILSAILSPDGQLLDWGGWQRHPEDPKHKAFCLAVSIVDLLRRQPAGTSLENWVFNRE